MRIFQTLLKLEKTINHVILFLGMSFANTHSMIASGTGSLGERLKPVVC
tara:strand:+ start:39 stop:185 length:147 start_codon:yes stop_codon:yes gene_type:complete